MSREIKFRCFYKIDNTMLEVTEINFTGNAITPTCLFWSPELGLHEAPIEFERDFELMQYTGLKDKHGGEIYEGDIVEFALSPFESVKGSVEFDYGAFYLKPTDKKYDNMLLANMNFDLVGVVGNIYENPKLLEEKI